MNRYHSLLTLLVVWLTTGQALGQTPSDTALTSLGDCIGEAIKCNLGIQAQTLLTQKAKDLEATYFELDPTSISLSQDPTSGGGPENSITVSQSFSLPSVYSSRKKLLKAETQVERQRLRVSSCELASQVASAYCNLLKSRDICRVLESQDSIYSHCLKIAQARHSNGEAGILEKMNAEKALKENGIAVSNAAKDFEQAQWALQALINTRRAIVPAENCLTALDGDCATVAFNAKATAADSLSSLEQKANELAVNYARKGFLPSVSLAVKGQMLIKGFNPYNIERQRFKEGNFMGFEVGVSLPLSFGATRGKVRAAQRDAELSAVNRERQKANMESTHKQLLSDYAKSKQEVDYYASSGMAQAKEMERLSQVLYANGEISYIELAQNLKESSDVKLDYINAINRYNQVVIQLNYLTGRNSKTTK